MHVFPIGYEVLIMAHISIRNLTVEFKVYGSNARSLKKQLLSQATGGRIASNANDAITVRALDNVSLEIKHGERIGLAGHNGSGKTTLLRTLAGIYKPTGGTIEIEGSVGALLDPSSGMDAEATGVENIYLRGYILGMTRKEIDSKVDEISRFTELGKFLELPVKTYSAGMFSRLGFAISTAINPEILLVDEGIGTGDAAFREKVVARTQAFISNANIAIFASHDQTFLDDMGATSICLEHGSIVKILE